MTTTKLSRHLTASALLFCSITIFVFLKALVQGESEDSCQGRIPDGQLFGTVQYCQAMQPPLVHLSRWNDTFDNLKNRNPQYFQHRRLHFKRPCSILGSIRSSIGSMGNSDKDMHSDLSTLAPLLLTPRPTVFYMQEHIPGRSK
jgi:hypothetical protein